MSKSLGNCIYLSDTADEVQKKVKSMYTDPDHLRVQDPGKIEGNTVFTYQDAFCRPEHFERYLPDYPSLEELKAHYQRGGLGDMKVKGFLNNIMQETLEPIRNRRKEFEKDIPAIYDMLKKGCETARETAAATLDDVRRAMKINYFDDAELIAEQVKKFSAEYRKAYKKGLYPSPDTALILFLLSVSWQILLIPHGSESVVRTCRRHRRRKLSSGWQEYRNPLPKHLPRPAHVSNSTLC